MKKNNTKKNSAQIKKFRHGVSILKKFGLVDKKYDARSVTPTKYLESQIRKFSDVIEGKAKPVKVSKKKLGHYKEQGFQTKFGKVIVPLGENEKVIGTHGDFVVKTIGEFGSLTRIDMGLNKKNVMLWREELLKRKIKLREGERIYFQFYGNNSYQTFQNFEQLLFYFEQYTTVENTERSGNPEDHMNLIDNLVIYKIDRNSEKPPRQKDSDERIMQRRENRALIRQRYMDRMTPQEQEKFNKKKAEDEKARRAKLKNKLTPEQQEAQKKKARERAKKSYIARSGKDGKKGNSNN
jgi:hypothetical protein